jgi:hypothetical protein
MKLDRRNPSARIEMMKMGIRVDRVHQVDAEHAWVAISGRNLDATEYRLAEFFVKRGAEWKQVPSPFPNEEASRPKDFPLPITDYEADMEQQVAFELKNGAR